MGAVLEWKTQKPIGPIGRLVGGYLETVEVWRSSHHGATIVFQSLGLFSPVLAAMRTFPLTTLIKSAMIQVWYDHAPQGLHQFFAVGWRFRNTCYSVRRFTNRTPTKAHFGN
jgi:hypothetical protein